MTKTLTAIIFLAFAGVAFSAASNTEAVATVRNTATGGNVQVPTSVFHPIGATPNDATDDKAALQACIDAAEAAGGGIVQLAAGTYLVEPLATGIGLLVNGDKVLLRGVGPKTIIRGVTATTGNATDANRNFELINAEGYNTTVAPYGASGLWVEDLKVECDSNVATATATTPARNGAGLIGLVHVPWAIIRGVTFGDIVYHQIEVQRAKNCLVENCDFVGNTESVRVQFDEGGGCGQGNSAQYRSGTLPGTVPIDNITFRNCRFAGRDMAGHSLSDPRNIELDHTGNCVLRNIVFDSCEIGPVYSTGAATAGYSLTSTVSATLIERLTVRRCRFLGDSTGVTFGLSLLPGTSLFRNVTIEDNFFGSGTDVAGTRFDGGFSQCMVVGTSTAGSTITGGGGGVITNYGSRQAITIRNNVFHPRLTAGRGVSGAGPNMNYVAVSALSDCLFEGNQLVGSVQASTATNSTTTWTTVAAHDLEEGDSVQLTTTVTLPTGFAPATTYYVVSPIGLTFKLSATRGGQPISGSGGSGTHTWKKYLGAISLGYQVGIGISEVVNLRMINNSAVWQQAGAAPDLATGVYSMIYTSQGLETGTLYHSAFVNGNRNVASMTGGTAIGLAEYGTTATIYGGGGSVTGNTTSGTWSPAFQIIHGNRLPVGTKGADIASAATLNLSLATGDIVDVTGTTGITAVTLPEGHTKTIRFTGILTFTHGASLVLPGNANITTAAGDVAIMRGYASGVVRCINYQRQTTAP